MMTVEVEVSILPVAYATIMDDPAFPPLLNAYTAECLVPDAEPQRAIYEGMERAGAIKCFGAYADGLLIGFASVLTAVMPHDGHCVATIESLFVGAEYRDTGAGNLLLAACRGIAVTAKCRLIHYNARIGSRLDKVLSRRAGCNLTHNVYTEWLVDEPRNPLAAVTWPGVDEEVDHV
jgi:GNAT superfamily N-acetyltransferase